MMVCYFCSLIQKVTKAPALKITGIQTLLQQKQTQLFLLILSLLYGSISKFTTNMQPPIKQKVFPAF